MADDAFISLRYAQRLLEGHGLTWDAGPRVEGYSNLTWVLGCALLGLLGMDLVLAARVLGVLSVLAVFAAIALTFRPRNEAVWPGLTALFGLAVCSPFAVWTLGGLEQPLVAALVAWSVVLLAYPERFSRAWRGTPYLLLALLALSRPDGIMLAGLICVGLFFGRPISWRGLRKTTLLFGSAGVAYASQLVFRRLYYEDWVPNPARIKLAFTPARLQLGMTYLTEAVTYLSPLIWCLLALLATAVWRRTERVKGLTVGLAAAGWAAYLAFIGGDIFPARRHVVVLVVLGALAAAELMERLGRSLRPRAAQGALGASFVLLLALLQSGDPQVGVAKAERWEWEGKVVGLLLKQAFGKQAPLLAVDPAGCLPFFSELPSIDMLGLNDHHIARNPPDNLGTGMLAHEFGDGQYVLSRQPDLALFCLPGGSDQGCFPSAMQMLEDPSFQRDYRLLTFEGRTPSAFRSRIWVRLESKKIGVVRGEREITIPGYFFAEGRGTVARLDDTGRLVAAIEAEGTGAVRQLGIPAGTYRVEAEKRGNLQLAVNLGGQHAGDALLLQLDRGALVDFSATVLAGEESAELSAVTLTRLDP